MSAAGGSSIEDDIVLRRNRISEKFWDLHHQIHEHDVVFRTQCVVPGIKLRHLKS